MTGLHWAAKRGHIEICEYLIKNNAHIDALDIMGRSPYMLAMTGQNIKVFRLLSYYKADVILIF